MDLLDILSGAGCAGCLVVGSERVLLLALCAALPVGICLLCAGYTLSGVLATFVGAVFFVYVLCRALKERRLPPDQRTWL